MNKIINISLFFLAAGILTSVSIISAYQILFIIPLLYFTYLAIKERNIKLPLSAWFLLAFTLVSFLSLLVNYEYLLQPSKNFGRLKYYLYAVGGILVFQAWLPNLSDKVKKVLVNTHLLSIVLAGLYAAYQVFYLNQGRASGLTETMRYGYGSAMILLLLISFGIQWDKTKSFFDLRLGIIAFLIGFLGMYLTYTRGALLGFLSGLPFLFYLYKPKLGLKIGAAAILLVSILVAYNQFGKGPTTSRFLMSKENTSDGIRKSLWKAAVIAIKEKPVLGWGLGNFHSQLKRIKEENDLEYKDYNDAHAHNLYLDTAAGTGFIGIILFLGWLITWAIESFRSTTYIKLAVIPMGVSLVISSMFETTLNANTAAFVFFVYSLSSALSTPRKTNDIATLPK